MLEKAYNTSLNAQGAAEKELATYLDSIEGRLSQLKATAQGFSSDLISTEWIKGVVSFGNALLTAADGAINLNTSLEPIARTLNPLSLILNTISGQTEQASKNFDTWKSIPTIIGAISAALSLMKKDVGTIVPFVPATEHLHKPENCWESLTPVYQSAA